MIKLTSMGNSSPIYITELPFNSFTFSGGEVQVQVGPKNCPTCSLPKAVEITADLFSALDIVELFHAVDALRRRGVKELHLVCKYFAYARQDRVMNPGEALGVKVMADMINSLGFESVEVWDAHSDTTLALLKNVKHVTQSQLVRLVPVFTPDIVLVAPDAGAMKKVLDAAKSYGRRMITAEKKRNVQTGEITETKVHSDHLGDRNLLIVDDICDGGATYVGYTKPDKTLVPGLVQALRPLTNGKIFLYFTHGIFSKGLAKFHGLVDHIYVANPFPGVDLNDPIISKLTIPQPEG